MYCRLEFRLTAERIDLTGHPFRTNTSKFSGTLPINFTLVLLTSRYCTQETSHNPSMVYKFVFDRQTPLKEFQENTVLYKLKYSSRTIHSSKLRFSERNILMWQ